MSRASPLELASGGRRLAPWYIFAAEQSIPQ